MPAWQDEWEAEDARIEAEYAEFTSKVDDIRKWLGVRAPMDAAARWYWNKHKREASRLLEAELFVPLLISRPKVLIEMVHRIYRRSREA